MTKLGWLLISFFWFGLFMIIDDNIKGNWAFWTAMPALLYIIGLVLILIFFAIKNTINDFKESKTNA